MINLIKEELLPTLSKGDIVLVPMGIYQSMNNGFAYDIALNFHEVRENEHKTGYGDKRKYGTYNVCKVDGITFVLCYIHNGGYSKKDGVFVDYDCVRKCLIRLVKEFKGKTVKTIPIGAEKCDGNGDKDRILDIFNEFSDREIDFNIYLFEQEDTKHEIYKEINSLKKKLREGEISREEYKTLRNEVEWRRKNGIFKKMPKDFDYKSDKKVVG